MGNIITANIIIGNLVAHPRRGALLHGRPPRVDVAARVGKSGGACVEVVINRATAPYRGRACHFDTEAIENTGGGGIGVRQQTTPDGQVVSQPRQVRQRLASKLAEHLSERLEGD